MNSIRKKFTLLNLISIFLCSFVAGIVGFWFLSDLQVKSSDEIMSLTCRQETTELNQQLLGIQSAVNYYSDFAERRLPSVEALRDADTRAAYLADMEEQMSGIVRNTKGVGAFYFRLAPELADESKNDGGFFYSRNKRSDLLMKEPLTKILEFDPDDTEHVGWFYIPKNAGKPVWLDPYYNKNVDIYMVSYVVPLYKEGQFIGVTGMDVDFNLVINDVSVINPYKTGNSCLVSPEGKIFYHPIHKPGTKISDYSPELETVIQNMKLPEGEGSKKTYRYMYNGKEKKLAFSHLQNGMLLLLSAETGEINAPQHILFKVIMFATLILALLAAAINVFVAGRIIKPLQKLTQAANQIAEGKLDIELPEPTEDEVGILTKSFAVTVENLKKYISGIQYKAYRDPLTHVRNKNAYDTEKERLVEKMKDGQSAFALLMLDINYLKKINDTYGHDFGDKYLLACSQLICEIFRHSPVYRIGGDEFLVILENGDFDDREKLLAEFDRRMAETQQDKDVWKHVSVAKGLAVAGPSDTLPDDVLRRADKAMYEDKLRMKVSR